MGAERGQGGIGLVTPSPKGASNSLSHILTTHLPHVFYSFLFLLGTTTWR